jgi:hypothetical protein
LPHASLPALLLIARSIARAKAPIVRTSCSDACRY